MSNGNNHNRDGQSLSTGVPGGYDYLEAYNEMYQQDRRFSPIGNQNYDIEKLWDQHYVILRMLASGLKPKEIASVLKIDPQTVSNVRRSSEGRKYLAHLHNKAEHDLEHVKDRLEKLRPNAINVFEDILSGVYDEEITVSELRKTANDVLDRSGMTVPKSPETVNNNIILTTQEIQDLHTRRVEAYIPKYTVLPDEGAGVEPSGEVDGTEEEDKPSEAQPPISDGDSEELPLPDPPPLPQAPDPAPSSLGLAERLRRREKKDAI